MIKRRHKSRSQPGSLSTQGDGSAKTKVLMLLAQRRRIFDFPRQSSIRTIHRIIKIHFLWGFSNMKTKAVIILRSHFHKY